MGDILSQDEIDALLRATEGDDRHSPPAGEMSPAQLRRLGLLHRPFQAALKRSFTAEMGLPVAVSTAFVDLVGYGKHVTALCDPDCIYHFALHPGGGRVLLEVAMPVVFALVDRACGGRGTSQGVSARALTAIEHETVDGLIRSWIGQLVSTWQPLAAVEAADIRYETYPAAVEAAAPGDTVALLAFEMNAPMASGLVSVCYPLTTLAPFVAALSGSPLPAPPSQGTSGTPSGPRTAAPAAEDVEVRVELSRAQLSAATVRQVRVGDVLRTDTRSDAPCTLWVGDARRYLGHPGRDASGRLQVSIVGDAPAT